MIDFVGARRAAPRSGESNDFRLDVAELAPLITPRTRFLIINSPANPTGGVLDRADLEAIARPGGRARSLRPGRRDLLRDSV